MNNKSLEVICIYRSAQGREVEFNFLSEKSDTVDFDDLIPAHFMNVMGGLIITVDDYKTIFRSTNFYTLMQPVSFLLHSLYWLKGLESGIWNEFDGFPFCAVVNTMAFPQEHLILKRKDESTLILSFLPSTENEGKKRGVHYFKEEIIKEFVWRNAVIIALEEYFYLFKKAIDADKNHPNVKTMEEYLRLWQRIK